MQIAPGNPSPLQPPDVAHIPNGTNELIQSGLGSWWRDQIDVRIDLSMSTWTPPVAQSLCYRFGGGGVGWEMMVDTNGFLQLNRRTPTGFFLWRSEIPIQAEPGERIILRCTSDTFTFDAVNYFTNMVFIQARRGARAADLRGVKYENAVFAPEEWEQIGRVETSPTDQTELTGSLRVTAQVAADPSIVTKVYGLLAYYNGVEVASLPQPLPAGQTTFTDPISGGSWATLSTASVAEAPWVTVDTARVRRLDWETGRRDELAQVEVTRATIVLDNSDRAFDPENSSGPYAGKLLPRVPVRIQAKTSFSDWTTVWTGFVEDGWQQAFSAPAGGEVVLPCVDLLAVAGDARVPRDSAAYRLGTLYPQVWLSFDEGAPGSEVLNEGTDGGAATVTDRVEIEAAITQSDAGNAISVKRSGSTGPVRIPWTYGTRGVAFVFWIKLEDPGANQVIMQMADGTNVVLSLFIGSATNQMSMNDDSGRVWQKTGALIDNDGGRYFFAVDIADTGSTSIRRQATANSWNTTATVDAFTDPVTLNVGANYLGGDPVTGVIDEFAVFNRVPIASALDNLWEINAGNEPADERIKLLCIAGGVPPEMYDVVNFGSWAGSVGKAPFGPGDLLSALAATIAAEQGAVIVDHVNQQLKFYDRTFRDAPPVPGFSISDDPADTDSALQAEELVLIPNGVDTVINVVEVIWTQRYRQEETVTTHVDEASVRQYGARRREIRASVGSYAEADAAAQAIFTRFAQPRARIASATLDMSVLSDGEIEDVLGLTFGSTLTINRQPLGTGARVVDLHWVEGMAHAVRGKKWTCTIRLSPAG